MMLDRSVSAKLSYICEKFRLPGDLVLHFSWIPKGHINMAYHVSLEDGEDVRQYLIQRVNWYVYRDPVSMMHNSELITGHLTEKGCRSLHYYRTDSGKPYLILRHEWRSFVDLEDIPEEQRPEVLTDEPWDAGWEFWRVADYVENSVTFESTEANAEVLRKAGQGFGRFERLLSDLDPGQLVESIAHFHDTPYRLSSLLGIVELDPMGRAKSIGEELSLIKENREFAASLRRGDLPVRITHNDTKLNNILFDKDSLEPLVIIDLDNCMPGHACYDFGDSIRFAACKADKEQPENKKLDLGLFRAYAEGYLAEMRDELSSEEVDSLATGAAVITLELAARYLEDYLIGDRYFRIDYPDQNRKRAQAQLSLFRDMMLHMDDMQRIIRETMNRLGE